jgi:hypothetical protein
MDCPASADFCWLVPDGAIFDINARRRHHPQEA